MSTPWYPPPVPSFNLMMDVPPSNSREMRNKAEKQRRDRLNAFIAELASLVPMVAKSTKRMDKTSILRLTATHLRIYQTLIMGKKIPNMQFPKHIDQLILEQLVCEQLGGFLLIVIPTGKIVFVSHTVENLLGHLQTDLMGQSLFQITSPDDHDRLKMYLQCEAVMERDWKKYFNVKLKRAGPRSESAVYEPVKMMGMHRSLSAENGQTSPASSTSSNNSSNYNYDIMVFFVKLCRPEPLIDRLIEASKDEYVTRHLIDGRIINSDQRISIVAGYMIEEVSGISAFKYMHRDDVRWVIIALRQMYDRGESRGSSCYRLQTRNGLFIYLRTFGFLEIDDQGTVESFVCVNTMVSEAEGKQLINEMKKRYSALINNSTAYLPEHESLTPPPSDDSVDLVEDPAQVELAVSHLMRNLPSPGSDNCSMPSPSIAQSLQENQDWSLTSPPAPPSTYPPVPTSNVISVAAPCLTTTAVVATAPPTETATSPNKSYQVRIKTASKRPPPTVDADHYSAINCNNKRAKTSQQLSSIHHQSTPYLRRSLIMSDCKPQPEKSIYRRDQLLKQTLQKK